MARMANKFKQACPLMYALNMSSGFKNLKTIIDTISRVSSPFDECTFCGPAAPKFV
jgi:hypothetical protein